jgi:hypothetical protein
VRRFLLALAFCIPLAAQSPVIDPPVIDAPVIDRGLSRGRAPIPQAVEMDGKGFLGDSFRLGESGEVWIIDAIRVWAAHDSGPACASKPGDQLEKLTLYGALYNPPIPGQPECDCHALVPVVAAPMEKGSGRFLNRTVTLTPAAGLWQIDFRDVRWSVPGGLDVLFAVRAKTRGGQACDAGKTWALAAAVGEAGYRLRHFDKDLVPAGFAEAGPEPRQIRVQVWARKQ